MKAVIIFLITFGVSSPVWGQKVQVSKAKEDEKEMKLDSRDYHIHRGDLNNSFTKFEGTKTGTVAFLGGSITYNGGWRDSLMVFLQNRFPETQFTFINAGIPSMGSTPAAFRLERDVLSKGPIDLLFEEAAVNDDTNGRSSKEQLRAMEGIVRHLWTENPNTDIVIMHFVDPNKMDDYRNNKVPEVIQNHDLVAQIYNIPVINLAKEVTERIDNGEFTWEEDFVNLHPSPFGQGIYAHSMITFLDDQYAEKKLGRIETKAHDLPQPLDERSYSEGRLIEIEKATTGSSWSIDKNWTPEDGKGVRTNYHKVPMLIDDRGDSSLKLNFSGSLIGMAIASGPDAGIVEYRIDNGTWKSKDLFTKWSKSLHLPWYFTLESELEEGNHLLELKLTGTSNEASVGNSCRIRYFYSN